MPVTTKERAAYTTKTGKHLTDKEFRFCRYYIIEHSTLTEAALKSYDIDKDSADPENTASSIAFENLRKPAIKECMRELLDEVGLTDDKADSELAYVLSQRKELSPKMKAINEYNKLKGRHSPEEQTVLVETIEERIKRRKNERD